MTPSDFIAHDTECPRPGHPERACTCGAEAFLASVGEAFALVRSVAAMSHEEELEDGMSSDAAVDAVNSLVTWARSIEGPPA